MKINKLNHQYKIDIFSMLENRVFANIPFTIQVNDLLKIGENYDTIKNVFDFEMETMDIKKYYTDELRREWGYCKSVFDRKQKIEKILKKVSK